jgi:hypothetical protein
MHPLLQTFFIPVVVCLCLNALHASYDFVSYLFIFSHAAHQLAPNPMLLDQNFLSWGLFFSFFEA